MGLLANNFRDTLGVYKFHGASLSNGAAPSRLEGAMHRTGAQRNLTAGQGVTNQAAGYPYGYRQGGAWSMPQKDGAMSSVNEARAAIVATGNAAQGINLISSATLTIVVAGSAAAVAAAVGSSTLAISVSGNAVAPLNATGSATLAISASANASGIASITGAATAVVTGSATTGGIGHMVSLPISQNLTVDQIAAGVANITIEGSVTLAQSLRLANAALGGKVSGGGSATETFRDISDTKDRVIAAVDASGNRTAITLDLS